MRRWLALVILAVLLIPAAALSTGTLTIPNNIFGQPTGTLSASLLDANWSAIATYVNAREITFDVLANRPTAATSGKFYLATDQNGGTLYADTGTAWTQLASPVSNQIVSQRASLTLANNGSATSTFLVFPGAATSDDTTIGSRVVITLTATITKKLTAWAVGSGNGCLDTGAAAAFTFYHVYVITRLDSGVVDVLCSVSGPNSATSPTMPANYPKKQRLGAIRTTWFPTAGGEIYFFSQVKNRFRWATLTSTLDVNNGAPGAGTFNTATVSVPNGVIAKALISCTVANTGQVYVFELNATDEAAGGPVSCGSFGGTAGATLEVMADPAQRIRFVNSANVATQLRTYGWEEMWD